MAEKIRKGDTVEILGGKDRGKRGKILRVMTGSKGRRVIVEGLNLVKKHQKPTPKNPQAAGITEKEMPLPVCRVALVDPKTDKKTRVGFAVKEGGIKVRVAKASGEELE